MSLPLQHLCMYVVGRQGCGLRVKWIWRPWAGLYTLVELVELFSQDAGRRVWRDHLLNISFNSGQRHTTFWSYILWICKITCIKNLSLTMDLCSSLTALRRTVLEYKRPRSAESFTLLWTEQKQRVTKEQVVYLQDRSENIMSSVIRFFIRYCHLNRPSCCYIHK